MLHWLDSFSSATVNQTPPKWYGDPGWPFYAYAVTGGSDNTLAVANHTHGSTYRDAEFPESERNTWPSATWSPSNPDPNRWYDTLANGSHIAILGGWLTVGSNNLGTFDHAVNLIGISFGVNLDICFVDCTTNGQFRYYHSRLNETTGQRTMVLTARSNKTMSWHAHVPLHIEMKLVMALSGSFELRVNQEPVIQLSGIDTRFAWMVPGTGNKIAYYTRWNAVNLIAIGIWPKAISPRWDNIHLLDGRTGPGLPNNDFLGDVKSKRIFPVADHTQQMTPSAGGQSWALVDELVRDTSDFVEGIHDKKDLYEFSDPPAGTYFGITHQIDLQRVGTPYFRTEGANNVYYGELTVDAITRSGGVEAAVEVPKSMVTSAWGRVVVSSEVDPTTGTQWTQSGLSNAQFGYRVREPSNPTIVPV